MWSRAALCASTRLNVNRLKVSANKNYNCDWSNVFTHQKNCLLRSQAYNIGVFFLAYSDYPFRFYYREWLITQYQVLGEPCGLDLVMILRLQKKPSSIRCWISDTETVSLFQRFIIRARFFARRMSILKAIGNNIVGLV